MAYQQHHNYHHGWRHPPSDQNNIFFGRECNKFTAINFDEALCGGRIMRPEVENFVNQVNHKDNFGWCKKILPIWYIIGYFLMYILILLNGGDSQGWEIVLIGVFLIGLVICITV